jgi:HK97 gp10 family phage protein
MFENAPKILQLAAYQKALQAGANVFMDELEAKTPIQLRLSGGDLFVEGGNLKAAIMSVVTLDTGARGGMAQVGFGKLGRVANWVEYGHRMVGHKPGKKAQGNVPAHPFMRPAFDASVDRAVEAFAKSIENAVRNEFPQGIA